MPCYNACKHHLCFVLFSFRAVVFTRMKIYSNYGDYKQQTQLSFWVFLRAACQFIILTEARGSRAQGWPYFLRLCYWIALHWCSMDRLDWSLLSRSLDCSSGQCPWHWSVYSAPGLMDPACSSHSLILVRSIFYFTNSIESVLEFCILYTLLGTYYYQYNIICTFIHIRCIYTPDFLNIYLYSSAAEI